jgi:cellulose synthase (UDP-forming)
VSLRERAEPWGNTKRQPGLSENPDKGLCLTATNAPSASLRQLDSERSKPPIAQKVPQWSNLPRPKLATLVLKGSRTQIRFSRRTLSGTPNPSHPVPSKLLRLSSVIFVASTLWYLPWLFASVRLDDPWLTFPLLAANILTVLSMVLAVVNNWSRSVPEPRFVPYGIEPVVGILIPTCGEPPDMVARTLQSVLTQRWPESQFVVIVGDDAHNPDIASMVRGTAAQFPDAHVIYHEPPLGCDPDRRGDAKAGNLNSCLDLLKSEFNVEWVETRDADDALGSRGFLRMCLGQLMTDSDLAFVQTIKTARVSRADPFDNNFVAFYRGNMFARHAANAVFPCGSGVVWRHSALDDIGGFPDWNLVEDLQSGVEAIRRGWRGCYLPIVGVCSQHAPEDIPNVYKQRGTWALDTMRLLLWADLRGLTARQLLHFAEPALYYMQCFGTVTLIYTTIATLLFHIHPLIASQTSYWLHLLPFVAALEFFLAMLVGGRSIRSAMRMRVMLIGLFPVFTKACLLAVFYGPTRKPSYKVTRKEDVFSWYWRETLMQSACIVALSASIIYSVLYVPHHFTPDAGGIYWAVFFCVLLSSFVRKSWFGVNSKHPSRSDSALPSAVAYPFTTFPTSIGELNLVPCSGARGAKSYDPLPSSFANKKVLRGRAVPRHRRSRRIPSFTGSRISAPRYRPSGRGPSFVRSGAHAQRRRRGMGAHPVRAMK